MEKQDRTPRERNDETILPKIDLKSREKDFPKKNVLGGKVSLVAKCIIKGGSWKRFILFLGIQALMSKTGSLVSEKVEEARIFRNSVANK